MKPYLFISAVLLFGLAVAPAPGKSPQAASSGAKSAARPAAANPTARGKEIYARDCSMCHGDTGNGQSDLAKDMQLTLKDWTDPKALAGESDQQIFDMIRNGKDKMPPEDASRAKDDDVKSLVLYIRDFSKNPPPPSTASTTTPNSSN
jgi:cytochrome c5